MALFYVLRSDDASLALPMVGIALLAFGLGAPRNSADYPSIVEMNSILGGLFSSRINMNLREKNGFTYGAFSAFSYYRGGGPYYTGADVRTDVTAPAAKELFAEVALGRELPEFLTLVAYPRLTD